MQACVGLCCHAGYAADDETSLIPRITAESYAELKASGVGSRGMIPKIENALKAVDNGVRRVVIKHAANLSNDLGTAIER